MTTERLRIEPMEPGDWPDLMEAFADFEASAYRDYDSPLPLTEDEVRDLTRSWAESGGFFSLRRRDCGEMIGYLCRHGEGIPDIGYMLKASQQGHGYALEALTAWLPALGTSRVLAYTALLNRPSVRLLKRSGFRLTGVESLAFRKDGEGRPIAFTGGIFELDLRNR